MSRDKQIDEMAKDVLNSSTLSIKDATDVAKSLYKRDYRKASEVVDEIFEKLKVDLKGYIGLNYLDELRKKYTEEGK